MPASTPLRLHPFAAMRYNPRQVGDIGEVTSPPYDMMDRPLIDSLLNAHPQNIVRLVLPRLVGEPVHAGSPYDRAAKLLHRWREQQVLVTDPEPALYAYEYGDATVSVCGIVGALELHPRDTGVVLPHEDVIPEIVADRLAMMSASRANLEPILLVYDGGGSTSDMLTKARGRAPLLDVSAQDGTWHRVWAVDDPGDIGAVRRALAPHQALIADGHHRYASYLQLRRRHNDIGDDEGPWDRGLAMLIDQSQYPLQLGAIHRSISEISLDDLDARPVTGFDVSRQETLTGELPRLPSRPGELIIATDTASVSVRRREPRDPAVSDAELLHGPLLHAWGVSEDRLGYHHTVEQTVRCAHQDGGVAVLMHPSSVVEVMDVARAGKLMPRKSTSFGPKPRTGLVMRSLDDEV